MNRTEAMSRYELALNLCHRAPRTKQNYIRCLNMFFDYIKKQSDLSDLNDLTLFHCQDFLAHIDELDRYAPKTYNLIVYSLRMFYGAVLDRNVDKYKFPIKKSKSAPKPIFTFEETAILLENCPDLCLKAAMMLACGSGLRISEITRLQFRDFNPAKSLICIRNSKGDKTRYVPVSQMTRDILRTYCRQAGVFHPNPSDYVFSSTKKPGHPLKNSAITHRFQDYIQAFSFYLEGHSFHSLRHVFATRCAEAGLSLPSIAQIMGHASVATTATYIHYTKKAEISVPDFSDDLRIKI